ncbi:PREDICTED: uncharacterized protein LOC109217143 [Nicotiana attenuata]|uniref:uncharacterized protein LOC109217143 n=1 Tax=Nicotiana attenuata TaxID=49451 RepID=UPI000905171E|nr:PREDICTED: uncharacterized protein LOC109217143 [Nicotiana attenuata]
MLGLGLGSDYPNSDQYTVVMVQVIGKQKGYELNMFSSEDTAGVLWQGYQLTTDSASFEYFFSKPAYLHHTLYWLMADGCVLAFDTKKKSARILNNSLHVIKHLPNGDNRIRIGYYTWFGVAKGKLHLVCTLKKYIVVVAYDDKIQNWEVVYTVANFRTGLNMNGRPLCLDNKRLLFLVYRRSEDGALYEYDFKTETYRILVLVPTKFLERQAFVPFVPTLAKFFSNFDIIEFCFIPLYFTGDAVSPAGAIKGQAKGNRRSGPVSAEAVPQKRDPDRRSGPGILGQVRRSDPNSAEAVFAEAVSAPQKRK